jgi:hypothetical protein
VKRLTWWRVGPQWVAVAVLLIPLPSIVAAVALGAPDALAPSALLLYPGAYFAHFFFGPLFEESGWYSGGTGGRPANSTGAGLTHKRQQLSSRVLAAQVSPC